MKRLTIIAALLATPVTAQDITDQQRGAMALGWLTAVAPRCALPVPDPFEAGRIAQWADAYPFEFMLGRNAGTATIADDEACGLAAELRDALKGQSI